MNRAHFRTGARLPRGVLPGLLAHTFHVEASDSKYRSLRPVPGADASPVLWHTGLTRYGATQLNERFLRQGGAPADPAGRAARTPPPSAELPSAWTETRTPS